MKTKIIMSALLALAVSANAYHIPITVICPNDNTASGIKVCATAVGQDPVCGTTDSSGFVEIVVYSTGTWTVCVDTTTLPPGATLATPCLVEEIISVDGIPPLEFVLGGDFCGTPPTPGFCWMTGGGTIGKPKTPNYSYGGVVYPGCSPKAADGGNWNVVDHKTGIHFQGQHIVVDQCFGAPTKSPKVDVRVIDFHGDGIVSGVAGNPLGSKIPVTFVGRAVDNHDGGKGQDLLYVSVTDGTTTWLQIGTSADDPAVVSTGNIQIHTSSCGK